MILAALQAIVLLASFAILFFVATGFISLAAEVVIGKRLFYIAPSIGPSMKPAIPEGLTFSVNYYPWSLKPGDIVTVAVGERNEPDICHRIIDVNGDKYKIKGDNNDFADGWVHEDYITSKMLQVNGQAIYIPASKKSIKAWIPKGFLPSRTK